jgi:hypothetical protein
MLIIVMLYVIMLSDVMLYVVMLSEVMLNVVMLSDVMLNGITVKTKYAECRISVKVVMLNVIIVYLC